MSNKSLKIVLLGSPNVGKTTLFNALTGLNQKTGNYPGITVEKKTGIFKINDTIIHLIDLPGIYNLFPSSTDEEVVTKILLNKKSEHYPDKIIVVINALNPNQGLFLLSQALELNIPCIVALTMNEKAKKKGISYDIQKLSSIYNCPAVYVSNNKNDLNKLKELLISTQNTAEYSNYEKQELLAKIKENFEYESFQDLIDLFNNDSDVPLAKKVKVKDAILRHQKIRASKHLFFSKNEQNATDFTSKIDKILTHPVLGYLIFFMVMLLVFQAVFSWSSYPTDWIDGLFGDLSLWFKEKLPEGRLSGLISDGLIPGVAGVMVFIPPIAFLFFFISLMEQTGYMARVVFLMDKFMQYFGMSGKSVVPLISGAACAVPAIMSARNIENQKERLITILTTPFMTCSARLPVYTTLIPLVIPEKSIGIFGLHGLTLMGLYLLGVVAVLISGLVLKLLLKSKYKSYLVIDIPDYSFPDVKSLFLTIWFNVRGFIWDAGKIIVAVSVILYVLASYGGKQFNNAEEFITQNYSSLSSEALETKIASYKVEHSYLGKIGKTMEPVITPLGYDWKIGIALISSIAAREVFVGSMAVIYSVGSEEETDIAEKMRTEINSNTGNKTFNLASGFSLLIFYAFALQCLSTIAVVRKETNGWKWALIQFAFMTALAYFAALITYQMLK